MIYFHIKVKFRWLFDWGKVDQKGSFPLVPIPLPAADHVIYNDRGVYLRVSTNPFP